MDGYKNRDFVECQLTKLKKTTQIKSILPAKDGFKLKINDLI